MRKTEQIKEILANKTNTIRLHKWNVLSKLTKEEITYYWNQLLLWRYTNYKWLVVNLKHLPDIK